MTETTPEPMTAEQIRTRLEEIAPWPHDTRSTARRIAVAALRRWHRNLAPFAFADDPAGRRMEAESVTALCYEFAALHLLMAMTAPVPVAPDLAAAQIRDAWEDGGGIGEWLHDHATALGIDTAEVDRLEDAWQALPSSRPAAETSPTP